MSSIERKHREIVRLLQKNNAVKAMNESSMDSKLRRNSTLLRNNTLQ